MSRRFVRAKGNHLLLQLILFTWSVLGACVLVGLPGRSFCSK